MTKEEIQQIYDYSKSKGEICKKLNIRINQNGLNIDKDILECFLQIGIESKEQISKKNLSNHWLEIQKRDYELNPKYCEYCGKKLPFEKRFAKCCNQSCGSALGNKKKGKRTEETKRKISNSLKKNFINYKDIISKYDNNELSFEDIYQYYPSLIRKCEFCGKLYVANLEPCGYKLSKSKYCSSECRSKVANKKISDLAKERIKNGTFQGWKSRNITSYAEKFWKQVLDNNNIQYVREYVLEYGNKGNGERYFLDFYIEINNRKIDLEIDGKQHLYEDRKEHDKIRDEYIKCKGIEVYRIPWNEINSENGKQLMKEKINNFLIYLGM